MDVEGGRREGERSVLGEEGGEGKCMGGAGRGGEVRGGRREGRREGRGGEAE